MQKDFHLMTQEEIFQTDPMELMNIISDRCRLEIPPSIDTVEEMEMAGKLLSKCMSEYSYFTNMALMAKLRKRMLKRMKVPKEEVEDALSREEIFMNYADIMKFAYNTVSRMITVKQQVNDELRMTDGR